MALPSGPHTPLIHIRPRGCWSLSPAHFQSLQSPGPDSISPLTCSSSKSRSQRWPRNTRPCPAGRNPRRRSRASAKPFPIRSMPPRSPRERGLQVPPARSPGGPGGPPTCPCVWGAIGPPSPAALVSGPAVVMVAEAASGPRVPPGQGLASCLASASVLTFAFCSEQSGRCGRTVGKEGGGLLAGPTTPYPPTSPPHTPAFESKGGRRTVPVCVRQVHPLMERHRPRADGGG